MNFFYYNPIGKAVDRMIYFICSVIIYIIPASFFRMIRPLWIRQGKHYSTNITERVDYYCRFSKCTLPTDNSTLIRNYKFPFRKKKKLSTYFFDLYKEIIHFNKNFRFFYEFGDITTEPSVPSIVKSRPITNGRFSNSVIMKLNRKRHFKFIHDSKSFREKKDMIISRNYVCQPHRILFLRKYFGHPMCNVGQINGDVIDGHTEWIKEFIPIKEQLNYKFICCIEGNDVATNLKWVMSSNSLPVMPKPTYESWFMEGTLIPDYHYVAIKPDYSDLIERMQFYIEHPEEAETIIRNNHEYIKQFKNKSKEKLISLLVLQKYFLNTEQVKH